MTWWFCVNKNGFINISKDMPRRNEELGKWEYYYPCINYILYDEVKKLVNKIGFSWSNDCECLTFS